MVTKTTSKMAEDVFKQNVSKVQFCSLVGVLCVKINEGFARN